MNDNKNRLISIGNKVKAAREEMGLTQEQFADKYGYPRTTIAKLEAGLRDFKSTEIITLAEQLNLSCDYLLGRARSAAPDDLVQAVADRYGLTDPALAALLDMSESDEQAKVIARRSVVNLMLSNEQGKNALERLALYFFGRLDDQTRKHGVQFEQAINTGRAQTYINSSFITDEEVCETLLRLAEGYFRKMRQGLKAWEI